MSRLYTPGPVRLPFDVAAAGALQPLHHRSAEFRLIAEKLFTDLSALHCSSRPVALLTGSGTTGLDAALASTITAGSTVIVVAFGRFGERIITMCRNLGANVLPVTAEWGDVVEPEVIADAVRDNPTATACWLVHSETSTGVAINLRPVLEVIRSIRPDILIGIDAITSLAVHELRADQWDVDIIVSASQKGLMAPPGLSTVWISERAEERLVRTTALTLNIADILRAAKDATFLWTPPVTIIRQLSVACSRILKEGLENVWQRHSHVSDVLRQGLRDRGLLLFGRATSNAVTAVHIAQPREFRETLLREFDILIAGGQGHLASNVVRIGTCGDHTVTDMLDLLRAIDVVLARVGVDS